MAQAAASPTSATFSLLRAYRSVARSLELQLEAETGLSLAACEVLARLGGSAGCRLSMVELAAATCLSRSGVSRVIDRLAERQLVRRRIPPVDRRTIIVEVTDAGEELMRELLDSFERSAAEAIAPFLAPEDLEILQIRLEKIAAPVPPPPERTGRRLGAPEAATCC